MHRAPLPFRAAGRLAKEFRHALVHVHPECERMAVVAVSGDDMVIDAEQRAGADGHALLPDIEMEKAANLATVIGFISRLLEAANLEHLFQKPNLVLGGEGLVDGSGGKV